MSPDWHLLMMLLEYLCLHLEVKQHVSIQNTFLLSSRNDQQCCLLLRTSYKKTVKSTVTVTLSINGICAMCCALTKGSSTAAKLRVPASEGM